MMIIAIGSVCCGIFPDAMKTDIFISYRQTLKKAFAFLSLMNENDI